MVNNSNTDLSSNYPGDSPGPNKKGANFQTAATQIIEGTAGIRGTKIIPPSQAHSQNG